MGVAGIGLRIGWMWRSVEARCTGSERHGRAICLKANEVVSSVAVSCGRRMGFRMFLPSANASHKKVSGMTQKPSQKPLRQHPVQGFSATNILTPKYFSQRPSWKSVCLEACPEACSLAIQPAFFIPMSLLKSPPYRIQP